MKKISLDKVERVIYLLRTTECELEDIGLRVGLSEFSIFRINKKYNVRVYSTQTKFTVNGVTIDRGVKI